MDVTNTESSSRKEQMAQDAITLVRTAYNQYGSRLIRCLEKEDYINVLKTVDSKTKIVSKPLKQEFIDGSQKVVLTLDNPIVAVGNNIYINTTVSDNSFQEKTEEFLLLRGKSTRFVESGAFLKEIQKNGFPFSQEDLEEKGIVAKGGIHSNQVDIRKVFSEVLKRNGFLKPRDIGASPINPNF